ncbi:MAG: glutathione reductase [Candidatus Synechococcus spongiarum 142]|uniref:Glutathione reductase n=1 Tax=Candidatus Synechococcus spongiarum 142 TaxID=1608213 RepID=A0A6N3X5A1_9SYNE|nr:MAG: glutathione reductase [Candidatus Synechococcus spongiarum 142]
MHQDEQHFDLVVVGAGSGGLAAAKRAASYGASVAIVEGSRVGGTCVIRGCVPKKLLVYGSAVGEQLADASSYGWPVPPVAPRTHVLLDHVRREVDRLNGIHEAALNRAGVVLVRGWGQFLDAQRLQVGEQVLRGTTILIAVGGQPVRPDLPGADLALVSDDLFLLERFPNSMVIIGGGYIACEFACILQGLGVTVTQVVRRHLLRGFDRGCVASVEKGMVEKGVAFRKGVSPQAISSSSMGRRVEFSDGSSLEAEAVLLATGRKPRLDGLNLAAAGVAVEGARIPVDGDQRTNVAHVFAVGDVTDRINLTPVAVDEGRAFADSRFGQKPRHTDHTLVASAVFTQPELATVGLAEEEARQRHGEDVRVCEARFRSLSRALPKTGSPCHLKLVLGPQERVLGCHMVGEHSAEIIQMAAIALGMGATKADFDRTMALHPSISEEFVTMG